MSKKITLLVSAVVLVAMIAVGATLAFYTAGTDAEANVVTIGKVEVKLHTAFDEEKVMPGGISNNEVWAENDGITPCYVRFKVKMTGLPDEPVYELLTENLSGGWFAIEGSDGYLYFYSKTALENKGELSAALPLDIYMDSDASNKYKNNEFGIDVGLQAIQKDHVVVDSAIGWYYEQDATKTPIHF